MDWRSIKFDWNRARAFLVTAEEGSLSAAARALGMTQPTLGRQVTALEEELGAVLFERVGRGLELTPSGLELLEHIRQMGAAASAASLTASGQSQSLTGTVCITASEMMAAYVLPPILADLRAKAPGIEIELIASNQASDLKRREADIAVRSFRPTQPDLIATKVGDLIGHLYASKSYLSRMGRPRNINDLGDHDFIDFDHTGALMRYLNDLGLALSEDNFRTMSESHLVQWSLAKAGLGIAIVPETVADDEPDIERVLPNMDPIISPIWIVAHRALKTSLRIRKVFDFLGDALSKCK